MPELGQTELTALLAMQEAHSQKMWDKVLVVGESWIDAKQELPAPAAILFAEALMVTGRIEEALKWAGGANGGLSAKHGTLKVAAMTTVARALSRSGDYAGSRRMLVECLKIPVTDAESKEKQGHIHLSVKPSWRKGWALHEARLENEDRKLPPNFSWWNGTDTVPVSVLHEQGIGDAILVARWLPKLAEKTGHPVTWYGPKLLAPWIAGLPGIMVGDLEAKIAENTPGVAIRAMSLPFHLRCDSPDEVPPPVAPTGPWNIALQTPKQRHTLRIGVCWKGSSGGWHDFERSYPYEQFQPIVQPLTGVEFVNLCHDAEVPADAPFEKVVFPDLMTSAERIARCHLVVSVDTSVVHLAGSLHVPTIALVPTVSDWRYEWPYGKSTPFYPSVTVIRRQTAYTLDAITNARDVLERFVRSVRPSEVA